MAKTTKLKTETEITDGTDKPKCFIIMPFGGWFDKYYFDIYVRVH